MEFFNVFGLFLAGVGALCAGLGILLWGVSKGSKK